MYSKAFDKFYWGFLFIILKIPIRGFDILPDIIGYILIYQGLSLLEKEREEFEIGKKFAFPMIFLSIFTIYDLSHFLDKGDMGIIGISPWIIVFNLLIGLLMIILDFKLIYNIFMGIKELAVEKNIPEIAKEAENRWKNYEVLLISTLVALFLIFLPILALVILIGIFIFSLILLVRIMQLMKQCKNEFI